MEGNCILQFIGLKMKYPNIFNDNLPPAHEKKAKKKS